jgi:hypothetical protein
MGAAPNLNIPVQGNANILNAQVDLRYKQGFDSALPWTKQIANEIGYSKGKTIILPWTESAKRYEPFTGEFVTHPWIVDAIQTQSVPWKLNVSADRDDVVENVLMSINDEAMSMGVQSALLPCDFIALALRRTGSSSSTPFVWYDGLPVFSETHPVDPRGVISGTWKNLFKGLPLTHQNVIDVYQQMCVGIKLPNGRQINVRPNKIGASGKYAMLLEEICKNSLVIKAIASTLAPAGAYGAIDNVLRGKLEPVIMDELAQDIAGAPGEEDVWYMWDDRRTKPVTVYWVKRPYVTPLISDTDAYLRSVNAYIWAGEAHGVAVVTAPWFMGRIEPGEGV